MKLAILTPKDEKNAETFIQSHIKYLPFEKVVIYGGSFPYLKEKNLIVEIESKLFALINIAKKILSLKAISFKAYRLKKLLIKENIDLVFAEYLVTGAEAVKVCKQLDVPLVSIALGYEISQEDVLKAYSNKYKELFDYAKNIFVVSNHMKSKLKQLGCLESKIVYTPIGPEDTFFKITPNFKKQQLLAVGRFVEKKAPEITIKAFYKVLKKHPNAILVMAGVGPLLNKCKKLILELDISQSVKFLGNINRKEYLELLESSYMFVQHSIIASTGDSEGTPVAILEASASGLPIVSTHHAGIPDVVINDKTGFLVPEKDVNLMSEKIVVLLNDSEKAKCFGEAGKSYVFENFSLKKHLDTITEIIRN